MGAKLLEIESPAGQLSQIDDHALRALHCCAKTVGALAPYEFTRPPREMPVFCPMMSV